VHREDQDRRRHRQQRRQRPRRDRRRRNRRGLLRPQGRVVQRLAGGECADLRRLHQQGCSHPGAGPRRPRRDAERNERVFTATFTLDDTTKVKGRCGSLLSDQGLGLLAVCDDDDKCRDAKFWDKPVDCEAAGCPQVTITFDPAECVNQTRGISLSLVANPFSTGLQADVDFGDGTVGTVDFVSMDLGGGIVIGSGTAAHNYSVPGSGQASFHVTVTIAGRPECVTTIDIPLDRCPASTPPPPPGRCPVERITLRVFDASGADVTARLEDGACLPPGRYVVRAEIVPAGATTAFAWAVGGVAAAVGQRGVVAINGARLTIELTTAFRSVSVIAAGCASDGVDLRPCKEVCCPELSGLTATCLPRCPPSTTTTLTATGTDIDCAEAFDWEFGDGATAETTVPTTTHTYASLGSFDAAVTIVRPRECGRPRTQRRTARVAPCPPSCWCAFLAIATGFLLLAFLTLLPLIACIQDPTTRQGLIIAAGIVFVLLVIAWLWWIIDPCCRPTRCELARILFWVFFWAIIILGIIAIFCSFGVLPFGFAYGVALAFFLDMINKNRCGPPPGLFDWPFPGCRDRRG
jgi:PKD domain-containing protein